MISSTLRLRHRCPAGEIAAYVRCGPSIQQATVLQERYSGGLGAGRSQAHHLEGPVSVPQLLTSNSLRTVTRCGKILWWLGLQDATPGCQVPCLSAGGCKTAGCPWTNGRIGTAMKPGKRFAVMSALLIAALVLAVACGKPSTTASPNLATSLSIESTPDTDEGPAKGPGQTKFRRISVEHRLSQSTVLPLTPNTSTMRSTRLSSTKLRGESPLKKRGLMGKTKAECPNSSFHQSPVHNEGAEQNHYG